MRFTNIFLLFIYLLYGITLHGQECSTCFKKKHFRFKLLKKEGLNIDTALVRTDGIYILRTTANFEFGSDSVFYFYRFFSNGKAYMSCQYCSFPCSNELNDLGYGVYGEYKVEDSLVVIETFAPYARYYIKELTISNGVLVTNRTWLRRWFKPLKVPAPTVKYSFYPCVLNRNVPD